MLCGVFVVCLYKTSHICRFDHSSYVGQANRATTAVTRYTTRREAEAKQYGNIVEAPSEDDVRIDEESDNASTSSQDAADYRAAQEFEPYIFSSEG